METIIRELHGPVDAMLSLCGTAEPEEGATASVVYANANACTQTEPVSEESSRQADEVRTTLGKRRKRHKDVLPKHKSFHCLLPVIRRTVIPPPSSERRSGGSLQGKLDHVHQGSRDCTRLGVVSYLIGRGCVQRCANQFPCVTAEEPRS